MTEQRRVSLRKPLSKPKGMAMKSQEIDLPGMRGTLPITNPRGEMSEAVKAEIQAETEKYMNEPLEVPEHIKQKAVAPKKPVNIDDLPPEKLEEIKQVLKDVTERPASPQKRPIVPRGPGIAEAIALAEKVNKQSAKPPEVQEKKAEKEPEVILGEKEEPKHNATCRHCGWPVDNSDNTNPDKLDKQLFVVCVLGQKRFTKEYRLFGGQLRVMFRTLTTAETDLVIKQLVKDWNDGKISGPAQSIAEATKYQMLLSLEAVETNVGLVRLCPHDEYDYDAEDVPEGGTVLPLIVGHVYETTLQQEPLRRAVSKAYGHFLDTVSKLEVMAETESFWLATED